MKATKEKDTRFDTRLSKEQKLFFEKAALLDGYRNLSSFVLVTVQNRANEIIKEQEQIIATLNDAAVFFDALAHPLEPNDDLYQAAQAYKKQSMK